MLWLVYNILQLLQTPPQSPDLNPIPMGCAENPYPKIYHNLKKAGEGSS
jgi:hypothetical protein